MAKNHYQVLSVSEDASPEQIGARYTALLQEFRKKLATGNPEDDSRLGEVRTAYQVLKNPTSRLEYDKALRGPSVSSALDNAPRSPKGWMRRAWRGQTKAWKLFWFFLVPTLLLAFALDTFIGRILLLVFLIWLPASLVIGGLVAFMLIPIAAAVFVWRCAFNAGSRFWGYVNRTAAVMSVIAVSAICYQVVTLLSLPSSSPKVSEKEYANKTPGENLLLAARYGDAPRVRRALAQGVDVHTRETARPNIGRTALHYAAGGKQYEIGGKHLEVAKLLLANGADVNAKAESGYTPLHVASGLGQKEMVELLLKSGADPNALDTRGTPLHAAVMQGQKEIALLLLKSGAQVNAGDPRGTRPLNVLANIGSWYSSHDEIVEILVNNGALLTVGERENMRSPLEVAISRDRKKLAMFLIDRNAPIDDRVIALIGSHGQKELAEYLLARNLVTFDLPEPGQTFLHGAACFPGPEFFDWVLSKTKNVNHPDKDGKTPLHKAAGCAKDDHLDKLIAKGANVRSKDAKGRAPMNELSGAGKVHTMLQSLIKAGADPNNTREDGTTVLMSMAYGNDAAAIHLLVASGADVNAKNRAGRTALHEAARLYKPEAAEALASSRGIKLNELDREGKTPLHVAAEVGAPLVVKLLVNKGADKSARTPDGRTALELAEKRGPGWKEIVELLK